MEEIILKTASYIKNGMSMPIGINENNNFVFIIKDTEKNINKFINKIDNIESIGETILFINKETKEPTMVNLTIIRMNTGNYYPLYIIEGMDNMLSKYNKIKNIELIFTDGKKIKDKSAIIEKETVEANFNEKNNKEYIKIFNFIKEVPPYELEALVAQVQRGETKPEIYYS